MNKTIIIVVTPDGKEEAWTNLKKACRHYEISYAAVTCRGLPVEYKGYKIKRLIIN